MSKNKVIINIFFFFMFLIIFAIIVDADGITRHTVDDKSQSVSDIVFIDLDSDGDKDIVVANSDEGGSDGVVWYKNDGTNSFTEINITESRFTIAISVADLTNNGYLDIVAACGSDDRIDWLENDGTESFTRHTLTTGWTNSLRCVDTADMNGDGYEDILIAEYTDYARVSIFLNDQDGTFTYMNTDTSPNGYIGYVYDILAADIDEDGEIDICTAGNGVYSPAYHAIWHENESGSFTQHNLGSTSDYAGGRAIDATDVDGDGDMDIIYGCVNGVYWFENDGSESFTSHKLSSSRGYDVLGLDYDSDGDIDIAVCFYDNDNITLFENDGSESFSYVTLDSSIDGPYKFDFDVENRTFVSVAYAYPGYVYIYDYTGSETFDIVYMDDDASSSWYDAQHVHTIEEALAVVNESGTIRVYDGSYLAPVEYGLDINKTLNIIGNGTASQFTTTETSPAFSITDHYVNISNLFIFDSSYCIYLEGNINHLSMRNITFYNSTYGFISEESVANNEYILLDNVSHYNGELFAFFTDGNHYNITDCYLYNMSFMSIYIAPGGSGCSDIVVHNTTFYETNIGVSLDAHESDYIQYVNMTENYFYASGIDISGSVLNFTFYNNYIDFQNSSGITIDDSATNLVWNISKTNGTNIIGGPYLGGNYWSDYTGVDTDNDGLGNTLIPYNNSGNILSGGDYHPLTLEIDLNANFVYSPNFPETDEVVHFTDKSTGDISQYHWSFGDGSTSVGKNQEHTYQEVGSYQVTLTVTNFSDNSDSMTKTVIVTDISQDKDVIIPPPQPPVNPDGYTIGEMYRLINAVNLPESKNEVTVVVIDSGVDYDYYNNVSYDKITVRHHPFYQTGFDFYGHGNFVNYEIAWILQQKLPNAHHISYRAFDEKGQSTSKVFVESIEDIKELNPDVVSISAGAFGKKDDTYSILMKELRSMGVIVVSCASGNYGPSSGTVISPALSPFALAVGASNPELTISDLVDDTICIWSSRGPVSGVDECKPDVVAPGESIIGPWLNSVQVKSGTSLSTPLLAGSTAVIVGQHKGLINSVKTVWFWHQSIIPDTFEVALENTCILKGDCNTWGAGIIQMQETSNLFFWYLLLELIIPILIICIILISILLWYKKRYEQ
ncbi:MAG: VCBS repeat-containing protein [Candidatus Thermoplasmatota archaeon]|nr:VCBS repeat-containing protein [Candidatus Thermoplasmatota archaeon]